MHQLGLLLLGTVLGLSAGASTAAGEQDSPVASWQAGPSVFYSTGTYGTSTRTTTLYVPFTMRRLFEKGDLSLVIP